MKTLRVAVVTLLAACGPARVESGDGGATGGGSTGGGATGGGSATGGGGATGGGSATGGGGGATGGGSATGGGGATGGGSATGGGGATGGGSATGGGGATGGGSATGGGATGGGSANTPPSALDDTFTTAEDNVLAITSAQVLANDTDAETPGSLVVTQVGTATNGAVQLANGQLTFMPAANFSGAATFDYTVSDGVATATAVVRVMVTPVNDAPIAQSDSFTTDEDTPLTLMPQQVLANDTDVEGNTLTVVGVANAQNGSVLIGTTLVFTPNSDQSGPASFEYTLSDGTTTVTGLVNVTIRPINDAPVAVDDSLTMQQGTSRSFPASQVLSNDFDLETPGGLSVTSVGNASSGSVLLVAGQLIFTPAPSFNGVASFTYAVSDGALNDQGQVVVMVTPNLPPTATDQTASTSRNTPLSLTLTATDADTPSAGLTFTLTTAPQHGTVTGAPPNLTYTPAAGYAGLDSIGFTVFDEASSDTGTVTLTVVGVCLDGFIDPPEQCDDGNLVQTDGCTTLCRRGPRCDTTAPALATGDRFVTNVDAGTCYVSFDDEQTTFAAAQAACLSAGGYLATITSPDEQTLVTSVQNPTQNPWLGATDDANSTDTFFTWVTGEAWGFTHFAPGQPDDDLSTGGNGDCLHLLNPAGEWNDTNCNFVGFVTGRICELPAP